MTTSLTTEFQRGELAPGPCYDNAHTDDEINDVYRRAFAFAAFIYGGPYRIPLSVMLDLGEDQRRAWVRTIGIRKGVDTVIERAQARVERGDTAPRATATVRRPRVRAPKANIAEWLPESKDDMHTCEGACGASLPASKFPTARSGGARAAECRACRDARLAEYRTQDDVS